MPPLVVYLDASDFSNFAKVISGGADQQYTQLYNVLKKFVDEGLIVCVFSYFHIAEIFKDNSDYLGGRVNKAKAIKELCGKNCFSYPSDIFKSEIYSLLSVGEHPEIEILSRSGNWFPDIMGIITDFRLNFDKLIEEQLLAYSQGQTRGQKRALMRQMRSPFFRRKLAENIARQKELHEQLEITFGVKRDFFLEWDMPGLMIGDAVAIDAALHTLLCFLEPDMFIQHTCVVFEQGKNVRTEMPAIIRKFENILGSIANDIKSQLTKQNIIDEFERGELRKIVSRRFTRDILLKRIVMDLSLSINHIDCIMDAPQGSLPSVDLILEAQRMYLSDQIFTSRKFRNSDGGDIMHGLYIPYCDIFRCDKYFSDVYTRAIKATPSAGISTTICGTIFDLPKVIENRLPK